MKRILSAAAISATALLTVTACSSDASAENTSGGAGEAVKVGLALPAGNQTYWTAYLNAAQEKAGELGVELTTTDAKNDANTQNEQVSSLVVSGAQGISIASVDPVANKLAATAASDAGIPLITGNRTLDTEYGGPEGQNPRVHVGFNDVEIGKKQGDLVVQACENVNPCRVVLEEGTQGSTPQIQRTQGLEEAIADSAHIEIIDKQDNDFDPTKAVDITQSLLQKHPEFEVLLTQADPEAVAAARIVAERGRADEIKVIGIGGSADGIKAVQAGDMYGTVWLSPKQDGALAIETIIKIINGEELADLNPEGERPTVEVPTVAVTQDNADEYPGEW